jgi:hypothetical protein
MNVLSGAQNNPLKETLGKGFSQQVSTIQLQHIENDGTSEPFLIPLNRAIDGAEFGFGEPKGAHKKEHNFFNRVVASEPIQSTPVRSSEPTLCFPGAFFNIFAVFKGAVAEQRGLINSGIGFQVGKESRVAKRSGSGN